MNQEGDSEVVVERPNRLLSEPSESGLLEYRGHARALCLDYGNKRIGVAISDIGWCIASPLKVINSHGCFPDIMEIIDEYAVGIVVVGVPCALNGGNAGKQREKVEKFVSKLMDLIGARFPTVRVILWDERYSSVAANRFLNEAGVSTAAKRQHIDKVAASFILQGILDAMR
ncbi:MAG: Holliday junction resolvase RuvX [Holosporales bacterium]|jgi:putative Holliday junction resolvase|nr:Holliday junction resolvase RuvX [Holosporales bacterium]